MKQSFDNPYFLLVVTEMDDEGHKSLILMEKGICVASQCPTKNSNRDGAQSSETFPKGLLTGSVEQQHVHG